MDHPERARSRSEIKPSASLIRSQSELAPPWYVAVRRGDGRAPLDGVGLAQEYRPRFRGRRGSVIRVEKDPMGMGGKMWHLSTASDLAGLDRRAARLVSSRVSRLFRCFP